MHKYEILFLFFFFLVGWNCCIERHWDAANLGVLLLGACLENRLG